MGCRLIAELAATGDTWVEAISNGQFNSWNQIGGSNTSYTVKT
jgi:hypothetical protein